MPVERPTADQINCFCSFGEADKYELPSWSSPSAIALQGASGRIQLTFHQLNPLSGLNSRPSVLFERFMRLCLLTFRGHDRWAIRRWQSCCRGPVVGGGAAGTGEPGSALADRAGSGVAGAHRACGGGGPLRTRRLSSAWARLRTRSASGGRMRFS